MIGILELGSAIGDAASKTHPNHSPERLEKSVGVARGVNADTRGSEKYAEREGGAERDIPRNKKRSGENRRT